MIVATALLILLPAASAQSSTPAPGAVTVKRGGITPRVPCEALRAAAARGPRIPRQRLAEDPELAVLAGDPAFEEILRSLPADGLK